MDEMHEVFESVARYFSMLGEPTRLRILHALCQEERCVNDIILATGLAQANVSRHLGLMYQAGMLSHRREGVQIFYKVADPMFIELCRTVSIQLISRTGGASTAREGLTHFAAEMQPRANAFPGDLPQPSANPKEKFRV